MRTAAVLALAALVFPAPVAADSILPQPNLRLNFGVRALGMGGAFLSVADDASAVFWNTAGLTQMPVNDFSFMSTVSPWEQSVEHQYLSYINPTRFGIFAFDTMVLHSEDILTGPDDPTPLGTFITLVAIPRLSWSKELIPGLLFGVALKYYHDFIGIPGSANIYQYNPEQFDRLGQTAAIDLGVIYNTPVPGLRAALALSHWGPDIRSKHIGPPEGSDLAEPTYEPIPRTIRIGTSYRFPLPAPHDLIFALDHYNIYVSSFQDRPFDDARRINIGLEYTLNNMVSIRLGSFGEQVDNQGTLPFGEHLLATYTLGLGFRISRYIIDWVSLPYGDGDRRSAISIAIRFGGTLEEKEKQRISTIVAPPPPAEPAFEEQDLIEE